MKILIAGGGTGGHLFSGVAVAEELRRRGNHDVLFVGTRRGLEARVLPRLGFTLEFISVGGLKRMGFFKTLANLARLPLSLLQSLWIVLRYRPDVALGVGGYASGPVILAAWLLGRKTVIIEQNSLPGVTNRLLGRFVRVVVTHFKRAKAHFPARKVLQLGNPVRGDLARAASLSHAAPDDGRLRILVTGGSQGAHAINQTVADTLDRLADVKDSIHIRHQSGVPDWENLRESYAAAEVPGTVEPFIDDMIEAYLEADLVICRAGASTCAELAVIGRPALFVPLPTAADDHQTANASELVDAGAAWMVRQSDFSPEFLERFVRDRLHDREELIRFGTNARQIGRKDAASDVTDLIESGLRTGSMTEISGKAES